MADVTQRQPALVVGRSAELHELAETWTAALRDGARVTLVGGSAGMGKTTLVNAFAGSMADDAEVLVGQCVAFGGEGMPYAAVAQILRELVRSRGQDQVIAWAGAGWESLGAVLPGIGSSPGPSNVERLRLYEAVTLVLEEAARELPLLLVIEDLHWGDPSTWHLLRFLAAALTDAPLMVLTTYRDDELHRRHPLRAVLAELVRQRGTSRLSLGPLDDGSTSELVTAVTGEPPSSAVTATVYRRSEGVPYFAEELARAAAEGVDMPWTLRDALLARVRQLSEATQQLLRTASAAGTQFDHDLLAAVVDTAPESLDAALREAVDAAILVPDDTGYRFRHALLYEAVHDELLPGEHTRVHGRFADVLGQRPELSAARGHDLIHHLFAAHRMDEAFRAALGKASDRSVAHHVALSLYERALEVWDLVEEPESVLGDHPVVLQMAAGAAVWAGEPERALALIEASLRETPSDGDPELLAKRLIIKARALGPLMRPGALEALEEAVALTSSEEPTLVRALALDFLGSQLMLAGRFADSKVVAEEAIEVATATGGAAYRGSARNTRAIALCALGEEEQGLAEMAAAREDSEARPRTASRFWVNWSNQLMLAGRYQQAKDAALEGVELARAKGLERSSGAMLLGNAADPMIALGELAEAGRLVDRALDLAPPRNHMIQLRTLQAVLALWGDRPEEAERILVDFTAALEGRTEQVQFQSELAIAYGWLKLLGPEPDPAAAWTAAQRVLRGPLPHSPSRSWQLGFLAASALGAGAGTRTDRDLLAEQLAGLAPCLNRPVWEAMVVAELTDDVETWRATVDSPTVAAGPAVLLPYAGIRLGRALIEQQDRAAAQPVLARAAERAARIGARLLVRRAEDLQHRAGLGAPRRRSADPTALTVREREVLALVAAGHSNGEIAAKLFISTKTASVHVSNILAKLGVASRGAAAARAHEEPELVGGGAGGRSAGTA
ncbi:AAA family ATPase [Georgenia subflava]|uniref:AAA family ATPase n=1 Tax=Georgenia subflava TaxID=1622177 RepID=A0A6N7EEB3_9MICO|nr:AAA family ATPase [Georgenia subflava]